MSFALLFDILNLTIVADELCESLMNQVRIVTLSCTGLSHNQEHMNQSCCLVLQWLNCRRLFCRQTETVIWQQVHLSATSLINLDSFFLAHKSCSTEFCFII